VIGTTVLQDNDDDEDEEVLLQYGGKHDGGKSLMPPTQQLALSKGPSPLPSSPLPSSSAPCGELLLNCMIPGQQTVRFLSSIGARQVEGSSMQ